MSGLMATSFPRWHFIILLVMLSLSVRIFVSPMHTLIYKMPWDMEAYIAGGNCFINVFTGHSDCLATLRVINPYGPLFNSVMALWIMLFGENYVLLKLPSILVDSITPVLIYLLALKLTDPARAICAALIYSLSFIAILLSGMWGNDDSFIVMLSVLSVLLMVYERSVLAIIVLVGAMYFKTVPALLILPFTLYWLRASRMEALKYTSFLAMLLLVSFGLYYLLVGDAAVAAYTTPLTWDICALSPLNLIRYTYVLPYHLLHPELARSWASLDPQDPWTQNGTTMFAKMMRGISLPLTLLGPILFIIYTWKYRLHDPKIELMRNTILMFLFSLFFAKAIYASYYIWFLPFVLVFFSINWGQTTLLRYTNTIGGFLLMFLALILFGSIFNYSPSYALTDTLLLLIALPLAVIGTYIISSCFDKAIRRILSLMVAVFYIDVSLFGKTLSFFQPTQIPIRTWALISNYGVEYVNIILNIVVFIYLFYKIHTRSVK